MGSKAPEAVPLVQLREGFCKRVVCYRAEEFRSLNHFCVNCLSVLINQRDGIFGVMRDPSTDKKRCETHDPLA